MRSKLNTIALLFFSIFNYTVQSQTKKDFHRFMVWESSWRIFGEFAPEINSHGAGLYKMVKVSK